MKLKPPVEGAIGGDDIPDEMRTPEESYWREQAAIERQERGEPPSKPIKAEWSTVQEVAARRRVKPKAIRNGIHSGSLKAVDIAPEGSDPRSSRYRIHRDDEQAWWDSKRQRTRSGVRRKPKVSERSFRDLVK